MWGEGHESLLGTLKFDAPKAQLPHPHPREPGIHWTVGRGGCLSPIPSLGRGMGPGPSSIMEVMDNWAKSAPSGLSFLDVPEVGDLDVCYEATEIQGRWSYYRHPESDRRGIKPQFLFYWLSDFGHIPPSLGTHFLIISQFQLELSNKDPDSYWGLLSTASISSAGTLCAARNVNSDLIFYARCFTYINSSSPHSGGQK